MKIWLITVGEPLPTDVGRDRRLRGGILADQMSSKGHEVLWWSSTMDHVRKTHRFDCDKRIVIKERLSLQLLHSVRYRRSVSLVRMINHWGIAKKFRILSQIESKPDVVLCAYPTVELAEAATAYGRTHRVPVVLDIRDLWPDIIVEIAPTRLRWLGRLALDPLFRSARRALAGATAITGITKEFVEWGLNYAGRVAGPWDRPFPMAYEARNPAEPAVAAAQKFWTELGVVRDSHNFRACFFGALGAHCEMSTILEAAKLLKEKPFQFVLCGKGDKLDAFKRIAAQFPNVLFPGWVGSAEIWTLMRLCQAGLTPYRSTLNYVGNLPNKPIEYLSGGLPIVSSLKGTLAHLLEKYDCGVTYENGDAKGLANALIELHENTDLQVRQAANSRRLFEEQFTAEIVYGEMATYLEEVAGAHRRKS